MSYSLLALANNPWLLTFDERAYWEQRLTDSYDLNGVGFLGLQSYNKWLYRIKEQAFFNVIANIPVGTVFDVGTGTGFYVDMWKKAGATSITGSDITKVATDNLSKKYPDCKFYHSDISSPEGLPRSKFDIISAFDVLYHIVDDHKFGQAIRNIQSLLNDSGYFLLSDNFVHGKEVRSVHQVIRTLEHITKVLEANGLHPIIRKPQFYYMNKPVDAPSWRKRMWELMMLPAYKSQVYGDIMGRLLYPFEKYAISHHSESPTIEIMVCRKQQYSLMPK